MGKCMYCGQDVGLLKKHHKECKQRFDLGRQQILFLIEQNFKELKKPQNFENQMRTTAANSFINDYVVRELLINSWENAVEKAFDDGVLSKEEEQWFEEVQNHYHLTQEDLNKNGAFFKVTKGAILREIFEGIIPERIEVTGEIPFNFQKNEKLVWLFQDVKYYEQKVRKQYVGGHDGLSLRIAKGVYYRTGAFRGNPVTTTELAHIDDGLFGVTDQHLYFAGTTKIFRIKFDKIVAFTPYSDGIGVQRDAATAKPQIFVTDDGWFIYNLISNLAKL